MSNSVNIDLVGLFTFTLDLLQLQIHHRSR